MFEIVLIFPGMNLQICFMNETNSDTESPSSDSENPTTTTNDSKQPKKQPKNINAVPQEDKTTAPAAPPRPATLSLGQPLLQPVTQPMTEVDFFARQARLQTEARMALAQAKEMARMQMEVGKGIYVHLATVHRMRSIVTLKISKYHCAMFTSVFIMFII